MKKKICIVVLVILVIISIIELGQIFLIKSKKFNIENEEVGYIRIKHHSKTCEIINRGLIDDIIKEFNKIEVKEKIIPDFYVGTNIYTVNMYSDIDDKRLVKSIVVKTNEKLFFEDMYYNIQNDVKIYDKMKDIFEYCGKILPGETRENIRSFEIYGTEEKEIADVINEYNNILDAKPIKAEEVEISAQYVVMETYDDEKITLYYGPEYTYIKYEYKNEVAFFVSEKL